MFLRIHERGLSLLLEILLGLGLFALGLLLVMGLFPTTFATSAQARNLSLASNLARQICEEVRVIGYMGASDISTTALNLTCEVNGVQALQQFTYEVDVTPFPNPKPLKDIVVTVKWNTGGVNAAGHGHSFRLQTYLAPY